MSRIPAVLLLSVSIGVPIQGSAQTTANTTSDPQAVQLASQAQAATSAAQVTDILVTSTAQWTVGGTQASGAATLKAKGLMEGRLDIAAGAVSRSEIRNDTNGPGGQWIAADGSAHPMSIHNCWGPPAWFAPYAVAQAMSDADVVLRYIGQETRNGVSVEHLQLHRTNTETDARLAADLERLSTVDVFLDSSSYLPFAVVFNIHPDDNYGRDIPIEVDFAEYRSVSGVLVPFHIQRLMQGVLNLDLTVTSASINSGLADSDFALD